MKTSMAAGLLFASLSVPLAAAADNPPQNHVRPSPTRRPAPSVNLQYYGGPVIARTQVVNVLWGTKVDHNVVAGSQGFYDALIASNYMDCLGEYDTAGVKVSGGGTGTNQHLSRGTSVQTVTIAPTMLTGTMMKADVDAELAKEITDGILPMPAKDPDGTIDTLYMVALPPGLNLDDGSGVSCATNNGWCASHYMLSFSGLTIPYAILPDYSMGGCAMGCGAASSSATGFDAFTFNASHEFVEAVTDPDDPPLAWFDKGTNLEIADACDNLPTIGMIGSYQVEEFWSKRLGKCIAGDPSLPLCNGTMRPCRWCTPADCTGATPTCVADPTAPNAGQCVAGAPPPVDGGSSASGSSSGGTSGSSGAGSGGSTSGGSSGTGSGGPAGGSAGVEAGSDDGGAGTGLTPGASAGCGCVSIGTDPGSDTAIFAAGAFALGSLLRRHRRASRA
jgi:hypothetical protein